MCGFISDFSILFHSSACLFLGQYLWGFLFNVMGPWPVCLISEPEIWLLLSQSVVLCQSFLIWGLGSLGPKLSPVTPGLASGGPQGLRGQIAGAARDSGKQRSEDKMLVPLPFSAALSNDLQQLAQNQNLSAPSMQQTGPDLELRPVKNANKMLFEHAVRTSGGLHRLKQQVRD